MKIGNLLERLPEAAESEHFETLVQLDDGRVERIVSHGHKSPKGFWYDQDDNEWVLVLKGRAGLEFESDATVIELGPGDYINIPAHTRHRVAWTASAEPTVWLTVHY